MVNKMKLTQTQIRRIIREEITRKERANSAKEVIAIINKVLDEDIESGRGGNLSLMFLFDILEREHNIDIDAHASTITSYYNANHSHFMR